MSASLLSKGQQGKEGLICKSLQETYASDYAFADKKNSDDCMAQYKVVIKAAQGRFHVLQMFQNFCVWNKFAISGMRSS